MWDKVLVESQGYLTAGLEPKILNVFSIYMMQLWPLVINQFQEEEKLVRLKENFGRCQILEFTIFTSPDTIMKQSHLLLCKNNKCTVEATTEPKKVNGFTGIPLLSPSIWLIFLYLYFLPVSLYRTGSMTQYMLHG